MGISKPFFPCKSFQREGNRFSDTKCHERIRQVEIVKLEIVAEDDKAVDRFMTQLREKVSPAVFLPNPLTTNKKRILQCLFFLPFSTRLSLYVSP